MANSGWSVDLPGGGCRDDGCPGSAVKHACTCALRIESSASTGAERHFPSILWVSHPLIPTLLISSFFYCSCFQ